VDAFWARIRKILFSVRASEPRVNFFDKFTQIRVFAQIWRLIVFLRLLATKHHFGAKSALLAPKSLLGTKVMKFHQ